MRNILPTLNNQEDLLSLRPPLIIIRHPLQKKEKTRMKEILLVYKKTERKCQGTTNRKRDLVYE